jgi:hypothetical protein
MHTSFIVVEKWSPKRYFGLYDQSDWLLIILQFRIIWLKTYGLLNMQIQSNLEGSSSGLQQLELWSDSKN